MNSITKSRFFRIKTKNVESNKLTRILKFQGRESLVSADIDGHGKIFAVHIGNISSEELKEKFVPMFLEVVAVGVQQKGSEECRQHSKRCNEGIGRRNDDYGQLFSGAFDMGFIAERSQWQHREPQIIHCVNVNGEHRDAERRNQEWWNWRAKSDRRLNSYLYLIFIFNSKFGW